MLVVPTCCVIAGILLQMISAVRCDILDRLGFGSWFWPPGTISVRSGFEANSTVIYTIPIEPWWDEGSFPENGMRGFVIPANPFNACTTVEEPPHEAYIADTAESDADSAEPATETLYFLLTDKDNNCDYETKVQNANASGYSVLITLNNGSKFPEQKWDHYYSLPVCSIGEDDGVVLLTNFTYPSYSVLIEDRRCTWLHNLIGSLVILGVCSSPLVVLLFVVIIWYSARLCIRRIKATLTARSLERRLRLLQTTISNLPIRKWARELDMLSDENKVCRICSEPFQDEEEIRILPCRHIFHLICVDQWILENRTFCPRCSHVLVPYDDRFPPSEISDSGEFPRVIVTVTNSETLPLIDTENVEVPVDEESKFHLQPGSVESERFDASFESVLHVPQNWNLTISKTQELKQKTEVPDSDFDLTDNTGSEPDPHQSTLPEVLNVVSEESACAMTDVKM